MPPEKDVQQQQQQQNTGGFGDADLDRRLDQMVDEGDGGASTDTSTQTAQTSKDKPTQQRTGETGTQQSTSQSKPTGTEDQQTPQGTVDTATDIIPQVSGRLRSDQHGNLVDMQGNMVAKAGKERRLWEENARLKHIEIPQLRQQLVDAQTAAKATSVLGNAPQQLGLNNDEAMQGLRLMASYRNNPVATIKYILAEAKANGVNLAEIVGSQPQIDAAAIGRLIDQKLQPIVQDREAQQQVAQRDAEVERQYNAFITRYPDVTPHEDVIASMLTRDPVLTPDAAYWQLRSWVQTHNLDWSKPLQPQIVARQQGVQQQNTQQQQTQQRSGGVPPMNTRSGHAETTDVNRARAVAGADADFSDIIRESMQEAGFTVQ